ncbi:MAG: M48 family metallopeptidase [Candidatus Thorarchaeota archaeon]|jgi:Zn-dependent protease with chaperone function
MVADVKREKILAIYSFLIMDIIQILFVSLLYLDDTALFVVGIDFSRSNPVVSLSLFLGIVVMQTVMIYVIAAQTLRKRDLVELSPTFDETVEWKCRYTRDSIVEWIQDLAKRSGVTIKKIYLMNSPLPNAFTFSLPILGSVVVVHSNTLDVLNENEVKAIITHEIGHIKNKDSIVQIFTRMPSFFVDLIYIYVYFRIGLGVISALLVTGDLYVAGFRLVALGAFFLLSRVLASVSRFFMQKASRAAELLGDYHAASVLGHEVTINALIRLGQRVEAITALFEEISWLESLNPERTGAISRAELLRMISHYPLDGIDEENARAVAPDVFLSTRLKHMREVYGVNLSDDQIQNAVDPAVSSLHGKRAEGKTDSDLAKEPTTVDWRKVDYDEDKRLSKEELTDLLKLLRENPQKMLFDQEVGINLHTMDHPDFRRRVLFIAEEFGL